MTDLILQTLFSGLLTGGAYALIALGVALVMGTMRVVNLAHGELVLLAAYVAYTLESAFSLNPLFAIPAALVVVCASSALVYLLIGQIRKDRELNSLILTYGIGIVLTNALLLIWKGDIHSTEVGWFHDGVVLGPLFSLNSELLSFGVSTVLIILLWWWLSRSWYGRALRAVSSNRDAARLMGVNPARTEMLSFIVAGVLATFAGVAIYCYGVIQPSLGHALTIKAFVITIFAGLGSIPGVLIGSLLIGVAEAMTVTFGSPALQELTGMVMFLVVLFLLPNGLLGAVKRRG